MQDHSCDLRFMAIFFANAKCHLWLEILFFPESFHLLRPTFLLCLFLHQLLPLEVSSCWVSLCSASRRLLREGSISGAIAALGRLLRWGGDGAVSCSLTCIYQLLQIIDCLKNNLFTFYFYLLGKDSPVTLLHHYWKRVCIVVP